MLLARSHLLVLVCELRGGLNIGRQFPLLVGDDVPVQYVQPRQVLDDVEAVVGLLREGISVHVELLEVPHLPQDLELRVQVLKVVVVNYEGVKEGEGRQAALQSHQAVVVRVQPLDAHALVQVVQTGDGIVVQPKSIKIHEAVEPRELGDALVGKVQLDAVLRV